MKRILVIEDEAPIRDNILDMLEMEGFVVAGADNGQTGLDLVPEFRPDLIFFLAGADPYERDQLGGLNLSVEGLQERGRIVVGEARKLKIPLVVLLAGGYAIDVEDTVSIHLNTIKTAQKIHRRYSIKIREPVPSSTGQEDEPA